MRILRWGLQAVVLSFWALAPAHADMVDDCKQSADLNVKVVECTAVIRSGQWSGKNLSWAYYNRGNAYANLGQYGRAIQGYDQILRLDPAYAKAYHNRGVAYRELGDFEGAVRDWERAIKIDGASRFRWWQERTRGNGHFSGAIDGIYSPGTPAALEACARDPAC